MSRSGHETTTQTAPDERRDPTRTLEGGCLCGGVRYRARGPVEGLARCCCRECRKASGAEFATNGNVARRHFELLEGEALLAEFESSPGQYRVFCGRCGSPLWKRNEATPEHVRLRLGCLDTAIDERPAVQVFLSERMALSRLDPDLPSFETLPGA